MKNYFSINQRREKSLNISTSTKLLSELSLDEDSEVCSNVASKPSTSYETIEKLLKSGDSFKLIIN